MPGWSGHRTDSHVRWSWLHVPSTSLTVWPQAWGLNFMSLGELVFKTLRKTVSLTQSCSDDTGDHVCKISSIGRAWIEEILRKQSNSKQMFTSCSWIIVILLSFPALQHRVPQGRNMEPTGPSLRVGAHLSPLVWEWWPPLPLCCLHTGPGSAMIPPV